MERGDGTFKTSLGIAGCDPVACVAALDDDGCDAVCVNGPSCVPGKRADCCCSCVELAGCELGVAVTCVSCELIVALIFFRTVDC